MTFGTVTVNTANPDPSWAIHAFLRVLEKQRALGLIPPTEHALAAQLLSKSAKVLFYSSASGISALVMDDDALTDEDAFEMIEFVMTRRKERLRERREAEAAQGGVTEGGDGEAGSVSEANSTRSRSDAPNPFNSDPADNHSHRDNNASGKGIE